MLRQHNKKRSTSKTVTKHDPENAQAWAVIMAKILALRAQGKTMQEIGNMFGVGRDTVSRWISKEFGGEKTTFGDMLRYAKALDVPFEELLGKMSQPPAFLNTTELLEIFCRSLRWTATCPSPTLHPYPTFPQQRSAQFFPVKPPQRPNNYTEYAPP